MYESGANDRVGWELKMGMSDGCAVAQSPAAYIDGC